MARVLVSGECSGAPVKEELAFQVFFSRPAVLSVGGLQTILVAANMQPDDPFPMDDKIKEAYSHVVENTAFFGDVALRFPRIVHHYFDRNSEWGGLLRWGLHFCNQTGVLTGGAHQQHVLTLMSQELGITEKTPDFMNPYRTERDDVLHTAEAFKKILREEEKRREKKRRGNQERPSHLPLTL
ncbi:Coiled-coil domain-containing protein 134 [Takifugu flavidus]|uniref:Coiled-coil domain-containing protein 134 n=2 Tax=Takifugu flavidus TaxID=433684 RepID=A0A5C6NUS0_9TELE|nr:Coiled-coil domain-containing protein 134 [Takifugu flavidus]